MDQSRDDVSAFEDLDLDDLSDEELQDLVGGDPQMVIVLPPIVC